MQLSCGRAGTWIQLPMDSLPRKCSINTFWLKSIQLSDLPKTSNVWDKEVVSFKPNSGGHRLHRTLPATLKGAAFCPQHISPNAPHRTLTSALEVYPFLDSQMLFAPHPLWNRNVHVPIHQMRTLVAHHTRASVKINTLEERTQWDCVFTHSRSQRGEQPMFTDCMYEPMNQGTDEWVSEWMNDGDGRERKQVASHFQYSVRR